jgi:hypothetical protein
MKYNYVLYPTLHHHEVLLVGAMMGETRGTESSYDTKRVKNEDKRRCSIHFAIIEKNKKEQGNNKRRFLLLEVFFG